MTGKQAVKIESIEGRLRLRWTYQGKRKVLAMGLYDTKLGRTVAESKAKVIEADLATGNYDDTLKKYKSQGQNPADDSGLSVTQLFQKFIDHKAKRVLKKTIEKYSALAGKVTEFFKDARVAQIDEDYADRFRVWLGEQLAPVTQAMYLSLINGCWVWGGKQNLVNSNPWPDVVKLVKVPPKQRPRPFTKTEINAILEGFSSSRYYSHYTDFVTFLFGTGCRTGEAIGLRWSHLEDGDTVWIGESVSRGVRKSTKTNRDRRFRLTPHLKAMLLNRRPDNYRPDDLVFPSPKGCAIDDHNFCTRAWKRVLHAAGVAYRKPYNTRHTFISHALAQNHNPMTIAQMTGHDPEVLFSHYAADISEGLQCPNIFS
jgi:integrase